jgi:hypothetical protein
VYAGSDTGVGERNRGAPVMQPTPGVLSEGTLFEGFVFTTDSFSEVFHPQQYIIETRDTVVPMNIEVPMKYLLSHNDRIVFFILSSHRKPDTLQTIETWQLKCY